MSPNLPATGGELAKLLPGKAVQLMAMWSVLPRVDHSPPQALLVRVDKTRRDEHGRRHGEGAEDRKAMAQHGNPPIVEGDGETAPRGWPVDDLPEGRRYVAPAQQQRQLAFERRRRDREADRPVGADGVVAEDKPVAAR